MTTSDTESLNETNSTELITVEKDDTASANKTVIVPTKQLTPEDVLEMLPTPPQGIIWKIREGKHFVHEDHVDENNPESYPFILESLKANKSNKDEPVCWIGFRKFEKETLENLAFKIIYALVKKDAGYSIVHPQDGILAQHRNLLGYYANNFKFKA